MAESQHTQNIQIDKVIGENEKNCVFYFTEKKLNGLFGQPNNMWSIVTGFVHLKSCF